MEHVGPARASQTHWKLSPFLELLANLQLYSGVSVGITLGMFYSATQSCLGGLHSGYADVPGRTVAFCYLSHLWTHSFPFYQYFPGLSPK